MVKKATHSAHWVLIMLALTAISVSPRLQAQDVLVKRATAINMVEQLFSFAVADSQTGVHITMNGMVEEWDSLSHFSIRYQLREMDLQQAEIMHFEAANEVALLLPCMRNEYCVKLTGGNNKQKLYSSVHAFTMPGNKERALAEILDMLKEIRSTWPR